MDVATKRTIVRLRVDRARDDVETARDMLQVARWRGAVNRAYYAVFHIASAALYWSDVERSRHSGIQAAFNQTLIKTGLVETEYGRFYSAARQWREEQDYSDDARPLDE
jgi:uncharacterized protein (UPF0332 family)